MSSRHPGWVNRTFIHLLISPCCSTGDSTHEVSVGVEPLESFLFHTGLPAPVRDVCSVRSPQPHHPSFCTVIRLCSDSPAAVFCPDQEPRDKKQACPCARERITRFLVQRQRDIEGPGGRRVDRVRSCDCRPEHEPFLQQRQSRLPVPSEIFSGSEGGPPGGRPHPRFREGQGSPACSCP
jgi:hypothetical protein